MAFFFSVIAFIFTEMYVMHNLGIRVYNLIVPTMEADLCVDCYAVCTL